MLLQTCAVGCGDTPPKADAAPLTASTSPNHFPTPERAVEVLMTATRDSDVPTLLAIFGADGREMFTSGDDVADRRTREVFKVAMEQRWHLEETQSNGRQLIVGDENWPFPVPIVRDREGWRFDTEAGKREVRARRIGRNELGAIGVCQTYVIAQRKYAGEARDDNPVGCYAQHVRSKPGKHDGLYWPAKPGEKRSPLGDLAAQAEAEGYNTTGSDQGPRPFHGYLFRILTRQGPSAPGGERSYLVEGRMTAGFALVAYPVDYGNSGIMTFIVNHDGVVHEADLGPQTLRVAAGIAAYDPDARFRPVD